MNFATLHFDTYKVVNLLVGKGYTKDEAEGFIEAIQEVTLSGVATKQDIIDLNSKIDSSTASQDSKINSLDSKLEMSIKSLEARLTARIYGAQIASVIAVIGALKLFELLS